MDHARTERSPADRQHHAPPDGITRRLQHAEAGADAGADAGAGTRPLDGGFADGAPVRSPAELALRDRARSRRQRVPPTSLATAGQMTDDLTDFRQCFARTIGRDTSPTELQRHVAVLEDLLGWCTARGRPLVARAAGTKGDALQVEHVDGRFVLCAIRVSRSAGGTLEIRPPTGRDLSESDRERVLATLNRFSRGEPLEPGDRLRIGFGALKNGAARTAVLELLDDLLAQATPAHAAR